MAKVIIVKLDGDIEKMFEKLKQQYNETNVGLVKLCIIKAAMKAS